MKTGDPTVATHRTAAEAKSLLDGHRLSHKRTGTTGNESDTTAPPLGNGGPADVNDASNAKGSGDDVTDGACVADVVNTLLPVIETVGGGLAGIEVDLEDDTAMPPALAVCAPALAVCERLALCVELRENGVLTLVDGFELLV